MYDFYLYASIRNSIRSYGGVIEKIRAFNETLAGELHICQMSTAAVTKIVCQKLARLWTAWISRPVILHLLTRELHSSFLSFLF